MDNHADKPSVSAQIKESLQKKVGQIREFTTDKLELRKKIRQKIQELRTYEAKVGVFGVTGVGKSSLCNSLFGKDLCETSDVQACTREAKELRITGENGLGGIYLIDVPGVGETIERDEEYFQLYRELMPTLDLVLWVIKADDRAYAVAERAYKEILKPYADKCPTLFVINQVDKINPVRNWDEENNQPGEQQKSNIAIKVNEISKAFVVPVNFIVTCSVEEGYNLLEVMDQIVNHLANDKKFAVVREAAEAVVSAHAIEQSERGIWEAVKEYAGDAWDSVKDFVVYEMLDSIEYVASSVVGRVGKYLKSWFK